MATILEYLDAARDQAHAKSDRHLSELAGFSAQWAHFIRQGKMLPSDDGMIRLAELAGRDPERALLDLNLARASSSRVSEHYSRIIQRLGVAIVAIPLLMANSNTVFAGSNTEQTAIKASEHYILSKIITYLLRMFTITRWMYLRYQLNF